MLVLLGIAFLAGAITSISPCVLPVLPILLAGSATGTDRRRPFAIVAGLVVSFTTFTLAGAALLSALGLPEDLLRDIAIVALLVLAASLLSRRVARLLERPFLFLTRRQVGRDSNGFLVGLSVGLVFVPCAGPVLAAVSALAASGEVSFRIVLVTAAYAVGAALPMLAAAVGSQRLTSGLRLLRAHDEGVRRAGGVAIGVVALAIAFGIDQRFTTTVPGYTEALQERIERNSTAREELEKVSGSGDAIAAPQGQQPRAPELRGIERWLNTPGGRSVSIAELRGKVVLVDFWTYSCINCLRTLPHLKAWDRAYRKAGLTIVGVHSPEFAFERVTGNVRSAVQRLGVRYPVALDNDFATWRAYSNDYWPSKYLIDKAGRIRYTHYGEGAYEETENLIRRLLGEKGKRPRTSVADRTPTDLTTRETYLGYARIENLVNPALSFDTEAEYRFPARALAQDQISYAGRWTVEAARAVAGRDARLRLGFQANDVFLVLGGEGAVRAFVNGRPAREIRVSGAPRLYTILRYPRLSWGLLELRFDPGVEGYAFTFG
ncbi:MAG: cytochrome c biogenesis protein DipZ [Actinobacteria bacterium]|nr:cytochrome c biogenesis protein DipZ [Actinomycetota bacterium]